jgi:hypothetical protein
MLRGGRRPGARRRPGAQNKRTIEARRRQRRDNGETLTDIAGRLQFPLTALSNPSNQRHRHTSTPL